VARSINLARLDDGERIIAAVEDINSHSSVMFDFLYREKLFLTGDGYIAVWHEHLYGKKHLHKMWDTKNMESVEKIEKEITEPTVFWIAALYTLLAGAFYWIVSFLVFYELIYYFDEWSNGSFQYNLTEDVSSLGGSDWTSIFHNYIVPVVLLVPLMLQFIIHKWCCRSSIIISFKNSEEKIQLNGESPYSFFLKFYLLGFVFSMSLGIIFYAPFVFATLFWMFLGALIVLFIILALNATRENTESRISFGSMSNFHDKLQEFLGLDTETGGRQIIQSLEQRLGPEVKDLKTRLEKNMYQLSSIIERWYYIFNSNAAFSGITAIRTCTEKILDHRLAAKINVKGKGAKAKVLQQYRDLINKHDSSINSNILAQIDVIKAIGNQGGHELELSEDSFLTCLRAFVELVEWHLENPVAEEE
jgi:hypothetical protein